MLPLLHMHQPVQTPPHLDPLSPLYGAHHRPDYFSIQHQNRTPRPSNPYQSANSQTRAVPIRSSHPVQSLQHRLVQSLAHGHAADHAEHQLRRKTPNGTIDAGYDGSPAGLATGPPPLKQIIMPASSRIFPTANVHRNPHPAANLSPLPVSPAGWPYPTHSPVENLSHGANVVNAGAGSGVGGVGAWNLGQGMLHAGAGMVDRTSIMQSGAQMPFNQVMGMQTVLPPTYQHPGGPTAFNPVGFNPPPVWKDVGMNGYRTGVPLSNLGYIPQNAAYDNTYLSPGSLLPQGPATPYTPGGFGPTFRSPVSTFPVDDGFSQQIQSQGIMQPSHRRLESLSLNPPNPALSLPNFDASSPVQFKERALAHAHKTYADLLLYLNQAKKNPHGRPGMGPRSASKMVVFPKPPKQPTTGISPNHHARSHSFSQHLAMYASNSAQVSPNNLGDMTPDGIQRAGAPTVLAEIYQNPATQGFPFGGKPHRMHPMAHDITSPLTNAKAALEMLSNLCEQSGWKWVDGMLLGGCLHYGLDHYEEGLEWFKRIINLDPSHVEAVSNIAATLYCLNRQEEAEQHWLQAIKIRPGYLEAVEHLVGLLCSNHRSKEAVDIINFVQNALRLPGRGTQTLRSPNTLDDAASSTSSATLQESISDQFILDADHDDTHGRIFPSPVDGSTQPGFGSSGYSIPGNENGRMLLLAHAKGNMLYALKDIERASEAFEEAVLISTGRNVRDIHSLIHQIQVVLAPQDNQYPPLRSAPQRTATGPLLLPPERAKHTAQLVFASSHGQLPGLCYVPEGSHRKSAISTTSNSLLSLAKIFQDAMSNGVASPGPMQPPSGVGDILALYYLSLSLQESPSTANNVGILLASVQPSSLSPTPPPDTMVAQNVPGIVPGSGLSLALAYYNYGLNLDPKHVHLHTNLGSLLKDIGQLDLAIQMYEQAVACDGTFDIALTNLANAVKDRGRISDAILYYRRAVTSNPNFSEAVCGLSTALNSVCDWRGRGGVVLYDGKFDQWHVKDDGMIVKVADSAIHIPGGGLMKKVVDIVTRQLQEASTWGTGSLSGGAMFSLTSQLKNAGASRTDRSLNIEQALQKWAGQPWEGSRVLRLVERSTRAAMRNWYVDKYVNGNEAAGGYPRPRLPSSLAVPSAPTVLPFHTFTCPLTAKDIRMISQRNALRISCSTLRSPWLPATVYRPPPPPKPHLNVGYVSSDFNNHPLAHLMQSVFGMHDQTRVKAFCYATTASDKSVHRQQIEREAPVFRDVSTWASDKLVDQIIQDEIHILVNLNGYTRGARNEIFAARPAPLQMSFMGFAGTLGAEWCDYLLADQTAVPPSTLRPWRENVNLSDVFRDEEDNEREEWVYSENIIYCRDTFFCCDHAQSAEQSDKTMTWPNELRRRWKMRKELFPNLADDMIILGNFNQLYKIDPTTFRTWLRILAACEKTVLWLLRFPELGETNLKRTAIAWAGEEVAKRIIFTDVAPKQQHIARARVCDLFLDTPECNAHTTSADVLWSSTPLLTLPRYDYKMCSRMAASILKGALPKTPEGDRAAEELIAEDDDQYEKFAIKLASRVTYRMVDGYGEPQGRLAELRKLLWQSKWSCALFDTHRWVNDLEDAYDEAWRRWVAGEGGDIYL